MQTALLSATTTTHDVRTLSWSVCSAPPTHAHARLSSSPPKQALKPSNCEQWQRDVCVIGEKTLYSADDLQIQQVFSFTCASSSLATSICVDCVY